MKIKNYLTTKRTLIKISNNKKNTDKNIKQQNEGKKISNNKKNTDKNVNNKKDTDKNIKQQKEH